MNIKWILGGIVGCLNLVQVTMAALSLWVGYSCLVQNITLTKFFLWFFSPYSNVKLIAQFWSWVNLVSMYYIIMVDFIGEYLVWASASISVTGIFLYLFFLSLPPTPPSQGSDWARELGWCKKDVSVFKCGFILVVLERAQASTVALPLGCAFGPVYLIS